MVHLCVCFRDMCRLRWILCQDVSLFVLIFRRVVSIGVDFAASVVTFGVDFEASGVDWC